MPHFCGSAAIVHANGSCFEIGNNTVCLRKPATGSFVAVLDGSAVQVLFCKREPEKETEVKRTMAIYHLEAKVVSRGVGRSAVAAAAYMSCSQILNDYDGVLHDYTRKRGLVWQQVFLPLHAPQTWQDRCVLWNTVEEAEKSKDSRLAREFVVALPVELSCDQWQQLLTEFIQKTLVADGMCADAAIHNTDGQNPHAHILLTVRPLDAQGKWQHKTEKEYVCVKNGEERGFTAAEFKAAQADGWEKQYPYQVGKKKVYLAPTEAQKHGYERVSKYPKSTKYGRQNPITERWNSEEQLVLWRQAWAEVTNRHLEQAGHTERIDHRSHAERGLEEQPTVHEGVTARTLERMGVVSDRCELNRQIKADNALLRELKAAVKKLVQSAMATLPALAEAMERVRCNVLIFCYQLRHIRNRKTRTENDLGSLHNRLERYTSLVEQINSTTTQRKTLLTEKQETAFWKFPKHKELAARIAELTELLEELHSDKEMLLLCMDCDDEKDISKVKAEISQTEQALKKLEQQESQYAAELDAALEQYSRLQAQAAEFDPVELYQARQELRPANTQEAVQRLQQIYGEEYSLVFMERSARDVAWQLHEAEEKNRIRKMMRDMDGKAKTQRGR